MGTSLSDNNKFPDFCKNAVKNNGIFINFRQNDILNEVLEHVSFEKGQAYYNNILVNVKENGGLKKLIKFYYYLNKFKENDNIGNPRIYKYPYIGSISPTTLRYINELTELESYFGRLDGFNICEIGGGYGGQCRIIDTYFNISSYSIIDLLSVLDLAKKYMSHFNIKSKVEFINPDELKERQYDLLISNYAFSECVRSTQDYYLDNVINHSKRGYIIYNDINPKGYNSYSASEIIGIINGAQSFPEYPDTAGANSKNTLVVWGHDQKISSKKVKTS